MKKPKFINVVLLRWVFRELLSVSSTREADVPGYLFLSLATHTHACAYTNTCKELALNVGAGKVSAKHARQAVRMGRSRTKRALARTGTAWSV